MSINQHLRLSPTLFTQLLAYTAFKADFHRVYIQAQKDPKQKWHQFPYSVSKTNVQKIVVKWPTEWRTLSDLHAGTSMGVQISTTQK